MKKKISSRGIAVVIRLLLGLIPFVGFAGANYPLKTAWTDTVSKSEPLPDYPRPDLVRSEWLSLNGEWAYHLTSHGPVKTDRSGMIRVPFPIESFLSEVQTHFDASDRLEYRRKFTIPNSWTGKRVLLHFDGVDWEARVELNGKQLGIHKGAYEHFTFDITDVLTNAKEQELAAYVTNPCGIYQLKGKQSFFRNKLWYTSCSGIWQSVWLEAVPTTFIRSLKVVPDLDRESIRLLVVTGGNSRDVSVDVVASQGTTELWHAVGMPAKVFELQVKGAKLWSPESPTLYNLRVSLIDHGTKVDSVLSYFGMRKIALAKDTNGITRIELNNHEYFQIGLLDQGYWPDGLYTAPCDEALRYDVKAIKRLGFNMCRMHVKVAPDRWYYWCDKLGLLVWQDIPSAGGNEAPSSEELKWPLDAAKQFKQEVNDIVWQNINHPSIVMWTAFNQGWGQHDTREIVNEIESCDHSRLVNDASGWNDRGVGDVLSLHDYSGVIKSGTKDGRAIVYGECGGVGWSVPEHSDLRAPPWSFVPCNSQEDFCLAFNRLLDRIAQARKIGASGAVITQYSDVESEMDGVISYDRSVSKLECPEYKNERVRLLTRLNCPLK